MLALLLITPVAWLVLQLTVYKLHVAHVYSGGDADAESRLGHAVGVDIVQTCKDCEGATGYHAVLVRLLYQARVGLDQQLDGMLEQGVFAASGDSVLAFTFFISIVLTVCNAVLRMLFAMIVQGQHHARRSKLSRDFMFLQAISAVLIYVVIALIVHTPLKEGKTYSELGWDVWESTFTDEAILEQCALRAQNGTAACISYLWDKSLSRTENAMEGIVGALDEHWYDSGGLIQQVTISLLTDTFFTPLVVEGLTLVKSVLRMHVGNVQSSQARTNELYEPLDYHLHDRYAVLIKYAATVLVFAPASPLLYYIAAVALFFNFWLQKFALTKLYKAPPALDEKVADRVALCLKLLLGLHVLSAPIFYARQAVVTRTAFSMTWPFLVSILAYVTYVVLDWTWFRWLRYRNKDSDPWFAEQYGGSSFNQHLEGIRQHAPIEDYRFPRDMSIKTKRSIQENFTFA